MTRLPDTHPRVHEHILEGGFSVQMSDTNTFGRIPVDQTIEETVNKDTQTAGTLYQVFKNTTPRLDQNQHLMI